MNQNPQAYYLITALLNAWAAEGYVLGVDSQLLLRELLQKLPSDIELKDLKTKLAPVLANTREEQELFYELFDKKLLETEDFYAANPETFIPESIESTPSVWNWKKLLFYALLTILLTVLGVFIYNKYFFKKPTLPPPEPPYQDIFISFKDKGEHPLLFNQFDSLGLTIKSVASIGNEKTGENVRFNVKNNKDFFYEPLNKGIDTVVLQFCFENRVECDTTYYRFIVNDFDRQKDGVVTQIDTLTYKTYDHTPNISSLIPTEKMKMGWNVAYWDWLKMFISLFFIAIILLLTKWLKKKNELILKDLKGNTKAPYAWSIQVEGADKIALNDAFYTASNQLRRRSDSEFQRLNMNKTVLATIRQGGRINFQYRFQTQSNEYLLLIDRQSAANHRSQTFNLLFKAFSENEVLIERFYYDGDIRLCWNETHKRGISLKDLQHKYPEHRLIIVGSAMSFLSPTNGKLTKWLNVFDHWRTRAIMTTRPPAEWDIREAQLATKFRLLPATLKGLGELVETIEAIEPKDYRLWKKVKDETGEPLRLPETLSADELMGILKGEFTVYANGKADDRLVQWIAACAVYPSLHWDLTLALGQSVGSSVGVTSSHSDTVVTLDNLFNINRLAWFSEGKIPESARKILLKWLADNYPSVLEQTRKELQRILATSQPPTDSIAYEDHRLQMVINDLYLKPNPLQRRALEQELEKLLALDAEQDFLVAEYLNRPLTVLDFRVPDNLRKFVRVENEKQVSKWRSWLWQVPLVLLFTLGLFCFNPKTKDCTGQSAFYKNTYYCVNLPQDSLTFLEQITCDTIERGEDVRLLDMYNELKIKMKDSSDLLIKKGVRKEEVEYINLIYNEYGKQIDSLSRYFKQNGYPDNASIEDHLLLQSYSLIRRFNLDSSSFYKNVGIAYWNAGVKHFNKGNTNSACIFFTRLDKWAWRDSVLTVDEIALIGKTCYPEFQQTAASKPAPKQFKDADFEVFQAQKLYGFRNSKTKVAVIPPQYQNALPYSEGLAAVRKGGKWGFIDYFGNEVIPPQYDAVLQSFKGGKAKEQLGKEQFFIDKKGRKIPELVLPQQPPVNPRPTLPTADDSNGQAAATTQATIPDPKKDPFEGQMVYVEGGTFEMGCDEKRDGDCQNDEKPVHKVTLSSYSMGKYEVTQKQWREVMGSDPEMLGFKGCDNCPVESVSWDDIQVFLKKLNELTGKKYRLPTEAEWEYASRGGNKSRYYQYSGSNDLKSVAWYEDNSDNKTHPVGTLKANELGIYDMSGNVWEWCSDWYDANYYKNSPAQNPVGAQSGSSRVYRGGSWLNSAYNCRSALRYWYAPLNWNSTLGFRLARD